MRLVVISFATIAIIAIAALGLLIYKTIKLDQTNNFCIAKPNQVATFLEHDLDEAMIYSKYHKRTQLLKMIDNNQAIIIPAGAKVEIEKYDRENRKIFIKIKNKEAGMWAPEDAVSCR